MTALSARNLDRREVDASSVGLAVGAQGLGRMIDGRPILQGIDLAVPRGCTLALLGANGAGKSTLLTVLATLYPPTEGTLDVFGQSAKTNAAAVRAQIGMIAHRPMLYRDLTLLENLIFFGRLYGVEDVQQRAWELLDRVGLSHRAHDRVATLSQGMTQRLAIARALMHRPRLLLADEPFAGLDLPSADAIAALLGQLHDEQCTIIVSLHDVSWAMALSQDTLVLRSGRTAWYGRTASTSADALRAEVIGS